jgi:hypothetical protein
MVGGCWRVGAGEARGFGIFELAAGSKLGEHRDAARDACRRQRPRTTCDPAEEAAVEVSGVYRAITPGTGSQTAACSVPG